MKPAWSAPHHNPGGASTWVGDDDFEARGLAMQIHMRACAANLPQLRQTTDWPHYRAVGLRLISHRTQSPR